MRRSRMVKTRLDQIKELDEVDTGRGPDAMEVVSWIERDSLRSKLHFDNGSYIIGLNHDFLYINPHTPISNGRGGFTLLELLVSITILVILVTITAVSMNWSADKDRVPNGANEVASFIAGGRDRAIFRRKPVGVRLVLNQDGPVNGAGNPTTVSSMMYVGTPEPQTGSISIEYNPSDSVNHLRRLRFWGPGGNNSPGFPGDDGGPAGDDTTEFGTDDDLMLSEELQAFTRLSFLGLIDNGVQISLKSGGSLKQNFTLTKRVNASGPGGFDWLLTSDYPASNLSACMLLEFEITPLPAALPNQEPRDLPRGVVIDLEASLRSGKLPAIWWNAGTGSFSPQMDIVFDARGMGVGPWAASGLTHLVLAEVADVDQTQYQTATQPFYRVGINPEERPKAGQERIVTVWPVAGRASVSQIDLVDSDADNLPDDPFRFAEVGQDAK